MDNKVTFTIEINTNGKNKLHEVSVCADDLKKAVGEVPAASRRSCSRAART